MSRNGWSPARHVSQFNEAAKQYIADHRDELLNQPLPKSIIRSMLIKTGYLQQGFAEKNGFGQQYVTGVVKNSAKGQPALSSEILGSVLQESDRLYHFQVKHKPQLNRMHTHIDMGSNNFNNAATINSQRLNSDTVYAKGRIETDEVKVVWVRR